MLSFDFFIIYYNINIIPHGKNYKIDLVGNYLYRKYVVDIHNFIPKKNPGNWSRNKLL